MIRSTSFATCNLQQLASAVQWELSTCLHSVVANWCPIGPQIHQWHLSTKIQQETHGNTDK